MRKRRGVYSRAASKLATYSPTSESTVGFGLFAAAATRRTIAEPTINPSATGASSRTCSGVLMPNPMHTGNGVCSRSQPTFSIRSGGSCGSLAGNAGDRNVIDKSGRRLGNSQCPLAGCCGRDQLNQTEIGLPADLCQRRGLLDQQVRHNRPDNSCAVACLRRTAPNRDDRQSRS